MGASEKLKLSLKLLLQRIKQLTMKKQSLSNNLRREIATLIQDGKHESARIRVEGVIREDYMVEAFEVVGLLSEVLIARYGLLDHPTTQSQSSHKLDAGIEEAVHTLIYAAPRTSADLKEMQAV